jgi:hypothetical protein
MRWQSSATILEYPLLSIAVGPDPSKNEIRGHARGVIAIGDMATGVIAVGGLACGLVALGGLAVGGIVLGGGALGLLALGGLAIGYAAVGGMAIGYYAMGGGVVGKFVVGPLRRDPQAVAYFSRLRATLPFLPWPPMPR